MGSFDTRDRDMTGTLSCGCHLVDGRVVRFCEKAKRLADGALSLPDKSPERHEARLEYLRHWANWQTRLSNGDKE